MLYKACVSFSGQISMAGGEVREISDQNLVNDLLKAGYIIEHKLDKAVNDKPEKKTKRKGKNDES